MKTFNKTMLNRYKFVKSDTLYFDIETTGFIHTSSHTYMIGMFYIEKDNIHFNFLFADNKLDEKDMLMEFNNTLKNFSAICTFNGKAFDIPYLNWRFDEYNIKSNLNSKFSIDMSRDFKPLKTFLGLSSAKQKSYEEFLGHNREDKFDGGKLIEVYKQYCIAPTDELLHIITLHNINDLEGMAIITNMYKFFELSKAKYVEKNICDDNLIVKYKIDHRFSKEIKLKKNDYAIIIYDNELLIKVPIIETEAKLYFNNYKDYFYLPAEDCSIHKSIAKYVNKNNKIKATKNLAYQKKLSEFIPIYFDYKINYKLDINDKHSLIPIENVNDEILNQIILNII